MEVSTVLHITQKGDDEIKRRVYKLNMKKRSLLILLDKPQTVEHVLSKTVLRHEEFLEEIQALIQEGFVAVGGGSALLAVKSAAPQAGLAPSMASADAITIHLDDEIILSEAKFLLTNFSVDSFGTQSQAFVDGIRGCKSVNDLRPRLSAIFLMAEKQCPDQLPVLLDLIKEINDTA